MVKIKELVRVDSKGRITIPLTIREALDIHEGMNILLIADREKKEIVLSPVPERARLVEMTIEIEDRPGVLAEIAKELADHGIDIIATRCLVIRRGEIGECYMVVDLSKALITTPEEIERILMKLEPIKSVKALELKRE